MYATSVCRMPIIMVQVEIAVHVLSSEKQQNTYMKAQRTDSWLNYDIENANVRYTTHPHKHKHTTDFMPIIISPYLCASPLPLPRRPRNTRRPNNIRSKLPCAKFAIIYANRLCMKHNAQAVHMRYECACSTIRQ